MASGEPGRTKAYDDELRWRIVYQRYAMDLNYREIANNVNVRLREACPPILTLKVVTIRCVS